MKPSVGPFARFSCMPEANLFLMFTQRLNTLGVAYMVSGSVAVIIYGEPRLTHGVVLIVVLDRDHIARLPEVFPPAEFYCPPAEVIAVEVARTTRTLQHYPPRDRFQTGRVSEWARSVARLGTGAGAAVGSGRPSALRCPSPVCHPTQTRKLPSTRLRDALAGHSLHARHIPRGHPQRRT